MNGLSTLVDQVTASVERLGRRGELTAQIQRIYAVDRAAAQLVQQLSELSTTLTVARTAGFAPPLPDVRAAATAVDTLRAQLSEGDVDREFAQSVIDVIGSLIRGAKEALTASWREYVVARVPSAEGLLVLADAFSAVAGASTYATRLRTAIRTVHGFLEQPPSADAVTRVNELAAEIPELLQQLVGAEPEVRAFADQLARGGAAIESLTPSVIKWMRDTGFAKSFKIVAGRPAGPQS